MNPSKELMLMELGAIKTGPCVSIYLPKFHGKKSCKESVIRFKNMRKTVEKSIRSGYGDDSMVRVTAPLDHLAQDLSFWKGQSVGVALFSSPGFFKVIPGKGSFDAAVSVSDRFHIKPLILDFQGRDRYYVLALNLRHVRLFQGDRHGLTPIVIPDSLGGLHDYSEPRHRERHVGAVSSGRGFIASGRRAGVFFHNYNDVDAKRKVDLERYFGAVDATIRKLVGGSPICPVILAALPEHQSAFRAHTKLTELMKEGMRHVTDAMSVAEISQEAQKIMYPHFKNLYEKSVSEYVDAKEIGVASDRLHTIGRALQQGRVKQLMIEQGRRVGGRFDAVDGRIEFADVTDSSNNDLLDDFASAAAMSSGSVVLLPRENMPTKTGAAAIFRY